MTEIKSGPAPEINKESKETEPKIAVDFFFSHHGTAEDFSRFPEALKNADVYVPEGSSWTYEHEWLFNEISQGRMEPPAQIPPMLKKIFSSLYNLKIPVVFVDIPKGHPLIEGWNDGEKKMRDAYKDFFGGNFDQALKNVKEGVADIAAVTKDREDFIADKLKKELKTLTEKFPQLKNKEAIRVLITLGAAHTSLHQKLKSELQLSKKILGRDTMVFNTHNEIVRRLTKNPQEVINNEVYARGLIETFIINTINNFTNDGSKSMWAARKLGANLSTDQIRSFSKTAGDSLGRVKLDELQVLLRKKLEEMGVKLPTTEEEIDKLLNIRKK